MGKKHKKIKIEKEEPEEKPGIRLVLKVGGESIKQETSSPADSENERRHRHKKKKKKHRHEKEDEERKERRRSRRDKDQEGTEESEESEEDDDIPPPKKVVVMSDDDGSTTPRSRRERKPTIAEPTPLQQVIDHFHKLIERKDANGFFAFPVTDNIAPMYSRIISSPMDLSTMRVKIDAGDYPTFPDYRADFKLMCENAMTYNLPDTIYYKGAQKLMVAGLKMMSKEKLLQLKRTLPCAANIPDAELGVETPLEEVEAEGLSDAHSAVGEEEDVKKPSYTQVYQAKTFGDEEIMEPEEIVAQAQEAARSAAESLTMRQPRSTIGFLRRREDGTTSFTVLNPDNTGIISEKERIVDLSSAKMAGKLTQGVPSLPSFKEDKRNLATPVTYLQYGPFSSFAPVFDSTAANLSKDDSDLLITTYGDETGLQYAKSLEEYVSDCGESSIKMVDNLLDILTGGVHSKTAHIIAEHEKQDKKKREEEEKKKKEEEDAEKLAIELKTPIDFDSLRSLSDIGINTSFLDGLEKQFTTEGVNVKLEETSTLLSDLKDLQYERLAQQMPENVPNVEPPTDKEVELADNVKQKLADLVKQVRPGEVASLQSIRRALGVKVECSTDPMDNDLQNFLEQATTDSDAAALQQGCDSPMMRPDQDIITIDDSS